MMLKNNLKRWIPIVLVCMTGIAFGAYAPRSAPSQREESTAKPANAIRRDETAPSGAAVVNRADRQVAASLLVPDPKQVGGEPEGIVQVANLVYAGVKSSQCFADHFLVTAEKESSISTSRRFHAVKLSSEELYNFPLVIMTGEGAFQLTQQERQNLRQFIERGGFLLASAGCSSPEWDRSFRKEMAGVLPEQSLAALGMDHPVFHTVYDIGELKAKHGAPKPLEGVSIKGRLGVIYSPDGLNDTSHTQGCCCCGGNEILNAIQINVNILAYSLIF
jgi:hypothetical protein